MCGEKDDRLICFNCQEQQLASKDAEVLEIMNNLDSDLVCIDFKRNLTKRDYQIITEFFNKINLARKKFGLQEIKHQ